jgi:hypothetical protein
MYQAGHPGILMQPALLAMVSQNLLYLNIWIALNLRTQMYRQAVIE